MPEPLRVVLFGMPDAGKSSLLGALGQAVQTQEHVLDGRLTDQGGGLTELQRRLYDETPRSTLGEVLPNPISFEPFASKDQVSRPGRFDAILIDCEGQKAIDLMNRWRGRVPQDEQGALALAILEADAVILVVDASANPAQVEADFAEFERFLAALEEGRGQRTAVGGLPVFLVLTKCDLLAQPQDELTTWMDRMEEQKRQVGRRFREFLSRDRSLGASPFGSIGLNLWATAVRRPALVDSPARPREPYGVAELFRQAFEQAYGHRERRGRSSRRLLWTVAASFVVIVLLAGLAILLPYTRPSEAVRDLTLEVDLFRARDGQATTPQGRLRNAHAKLSDLAKIEKNAVFEKLSPEYQDYVRQREGELAAFIDFGDKLDKFPDVRDIRKEAELTSIKERLRQLAPPSEYERAWSQTETGRDYVQMRDDVQAIEKEVNRVKAGYQELIQEGTTVSNDMGPDLPRRAKAVIDKSLDLPDPARDKDRKILGSGRVTYATIFGVESVEEVFRGWDTEVKQILLPFAKRAKAP